MLRPCLDAEWNELRLSPGALAAWYLGFVVEVHKRAGFWPAIYGSPSYLESFARLHPLEFGRCPLWLAEYGVRRPSVPAPWSHWCAWQWTPHRYDPAVGSYVDDSFVADAAALLVPGPIVRRRAKRSRS
jgi:GH25 family lysozyme M1 (1,4-beta-N-acetylmuramidase)